MIFALDAVLSGNGITQDFSFENIENYNQARQLFQLFKIGGKQLS